MKLVYSLKYTNFPGGSDVKHLSTMQETWVQSLGWEDSLEKEVATHSSTLAWKIPWTEELGADHCPWGRKESGTTEQLHFTSLPASWIHRWHQWPGGVCLLHHHNPRAQPRHLEPPKQGGEGGPAEEAPAKPCEVVGWQEEGIASSKSDCELS